MQGKTDGITIILMIIGRSSLQLEQARRVLEVQSVAGDLVACELQVKTTAAVVRASREQRVRSRRAAGLV